MKIKYEIIIVLCFLLSLAWACKNDEAMEVVIFSDEDLLSALLEQGIDSNYDGSISVTEAESVRKINILATNISELGGLEAFSNLDSLVLKMVPIKLMNLSGIPGLRYLECDMCDLKYVDLSGNFNLEEIICDNNQIDTLKLPSGLVLKTLRCGYNRLRELDLSGNPALESLHCNNNLLTWLDLSNNTVLTRMISCGNQLTSLDVSKNNSITLLGVDNMPMLLVVYVWTLPFPPEGVNVLMNYSPRLNFTLAK